MILTDAVEKLPIELDPSIPVVLNQGWLCTPDPGDTGQCLEALLDVVTAQMLLLHLEGERPGMPLCILPCKEQPRSRGQWGPEHR